ncbi:MAG: glycosyltransferase family protein [Dehalococcoidales bacterium]|jgi:spore coat polysaccharide biosynthesis protein SpsF|nr:glycosyltransferase family protein [Dehalococcoidales bacterium]
MIIAIVQARMNSTRLPGKVLKNIESKPMLWHIINRLKKAKLIDKIVIATGSKSENKPILKLAEEMSIDTFTGCEQDVLDRFYQAAIKYNAKVIVRITADCPIIDPCIIDVAIKLYMQGSYDYVTNAFERTYPDGLDVEVFSFAALEISWRKAKWASEREHVTPYIHKNPNKFRLANIENKTDLSRLRWSVDEEKDLEFVRRIYKHLHKDGQIFYMEDVVRLLAEHPELKKINRAIAINEGYIKSLEGDRLVR